MPSDAFSKDTLNPGFVEFGSEFDKHWGLADSDALAGVAAESPGQMVPETTTTAVFPVTLVEPGVRSCAERDWWAMMVWRTAKSLRLLGSTSDAASFNRCENTSFVYATATAPGVDSGPDWDARPHAPARQTTVARTPVQTTPPTILPVGHLAGARFVSQQDPGTSFQGVSTCGLAFHRRFP